MNIDHVADNLSRSYQDGYNAGYADGIAEKDVREVVRGHWVTVEEAMRRGDYLLAHTCSVCGACDWDCTESENFNFCPNCGADMREG